MKKLTLLIAIVMIMTISLVSCGKGKTESNLNSTEQSESSVEVAENSESVPVEDESESENEKEKPAVTFRIKSCPAETPEGTVYHWAMLQTDRAQVDEENMQRINERLQALGIDGSLQIHYVAIPTNELVTAETIQQVYEQLEEKMDFISISPEYIAISKDDWQDNFIELTEKLHTGALKDFYEIVPDNLWRANQIAGGIYSFSSAKEVNMRVLCFEEPMVESMGLENICRIQEANGLENEEVWKELYELRNKPIAVWEAGIGSVHGLAEGLPNYSALSGFTGCWEEQYFEELNGMDYIRYNFETNQYEWLGASEKYLALRERVLDFYDKGYITNLDYEMLHTDRIDEFYDGVAKLVEGVDNQIHTETIDTGEKEEEQVLVPMWNESHVVTKEEEDFLYSCVYRKAQSGWEQVLDAMGSDEELICLLNFGIKDRDFTVGGKSGNYIQTIYDVDEETGEPIGFYGRSRFYSILLSSELCRKVEIPGYDACMAEYDSPYEFLEELYGNATISANTDFVFNPAPVQEERKKCNEWAGFTSNNDCTISIEKPGERPIVKFSLDKVLNNWDAYIISMENNAPLEVVVEEANRQLAEWSQK